MLRSSSGNGRQPSRERDLLLTMRGRIYKARPEAMAAFARLKKAGCNPTTLTDLLFRAAFARAVLLYQRIAKPSPSFFGSLWRVDAHEQKRLQEDLRRTADQLDLLLGSAIMSPSVVLPRLLPKYEFGPENPRSGAIRALAERDFPRLPALLRALAEYLECFGAKLRRGWSAARVLKAQQEDALVALLEYDAAATHEAPHFAKLSPLLRGALSFFLHYAPKELTAAVAARDPFSRKALEALYRRRVRPASIELATAGPPKPGVS